MYHETNDRNIDLYTAFCRVMGNSKRPIPLITALRLTVKQPAKRFYVSSTRAIEVIRKIRNGAPIQLRNERIQMFIDILHIVEQLERKYPNRSLRDIVEEAIEHPAPEFYIKPSSAKIILHHERNRQKRLQRQRTKR